MVSYRSSSTLRASTRNGLRLTTAGLAALVLVLSLGATTTTLRAPASGIATTTGPGTSA